MDRYYGRNFRPHKMVGWVRVTVLDEDEIAEYRLGFDEETDRKEWR
jgi:hypothetical protein